LEDGSGSGKGSGEGSSEGSGEGEPLCTNFQSTGRFSSFKLEVLNVNKPVTFVLVVR
jgi:hypothetical protein